MTDSDEPQKTAKLSFHSVIPLSCMLCVVIHLIILICQVHSNKIILATPLYLLDVSKFTYMVEPMLVNKTFLRNSYLPFQEKNR